ncbi:MAG: tRNA (adenosine(37)-N6)-threonylcarbamoyltransferase complex dimerization subunit type 1 TsaB [Lachnospiraceae bacterium]|nr:tRNA (adenosine(37)-N6)-threonylcarbamoyltransferase complex dimerization subunit type 1 TsaB [Lachnospiraceae bacterium]
MTIIGIDSSGTTASVSVISDGKVLSALTQDTAYTHSRTLLPMVDNAIKMADIKKEEIDLVAVANGPGSFTGLRIGAGTAKGLAMAFDTKIVEVPTLDALAFRLIYSDGLICPIMNARRSQVYTATYETVFENEAYENPSLKEVLPMEAIDIYELMDKLAGLGKKICFTGDGIEEFRETIINEFKAPFEFAPPHLSRQSAASVALLGEKYYNQGRAIDIDKFKILYLRKSQAEREKGL